MIRVEVGDGWAAIVLNIIVVGSGYPNEWGFRFHRAWRNGGRMRIHVTTDTDDMDALMATVALNDIAWSRSGMTCEICGTTSAHLRLGQRYALTLCDEHRYLVGEPHPGDGKVREIGRDQQHWLPPGYDDPDVMKDDLLKMWSRGVAAMHDVQQLLQKSRAGVMDAATETGYCLKLEDDPDAEAKGAEIARLLSWVKDDGTRH